MDTTPIKRKALALSALVDAGRWNDEVCAVGSFVDRPLTVVPVIDLGTDE